MTHGEGEGGLTPFILLPARFSSRPHPSSLRGVRLNFRGCGAKFLYAAQLPRRSSSRVWAVRRDERGRRRTGQVRALFIFTNTSFHIPLVFTHLLSTESLKTIQNSHETIKNLELLIYMKIENGQSCVQPEQGGLPKHGLFET